MTTEVYLQCREIGCCCECGYKHEADGRRQLKVADFGNLDQLLMLSEHTCVIRPALA